jgi:hypothetical protein
MVSVAATPSNGPLTAVSVAGTAVPDISMAKSAAPNALLLFILSLLQLLYSRILALTALGCACFRRFRRYRPGILRNRKHP